ncbi:MAG: energy transducer TonB [Epsilonproteobacteria bacterium]|nr:energy transducer TonB [Campylobacterota bacterium]
MIRTVFSVIPAIGLVFLLFWSLQMMIKVGGTPVLKEKDLHMVDFVRLKKEQQLIKKERVKPKKPKPKKEPPKPKVNIQKNVKVTKKPLIHERIDMDLPLDLSAVSALGDASVLALGGREISTNVIPLARIDPIYPKRAKMMKKEGYVKMEFTITTFGTVKDVKVVESSPEGLFDSSAKRAILKWKFRPKLEEGQAIEQRAMLQIDFKLDR